MENRQYGLFWNLMKRLTRTEKAKVLSENIRVHAVEAGIYDQLHSEIYNWYEQRATRKWVKDAIDLVGRPLPLSALDIGCGTGNIILKLDAFGIDVSGVDISKHMIDVLHKKGFPVNQLICNDIDSFIDDSSGDDYDIIAISSLLHHLPNYIETLSNVTEMIKRGGVLFILHEPIKIQNISRSFGTRVIKVINLSFGLISQIWKRMKGIKSPLLDYRYSDYHSSDGIDVDKIMDVLTQADIAVRQIEYYTTAKTGLLAFLNNKIFQSPPNSFMMLGKKK